ncbi:MAG: hypothetical protein RR090_09170 [Niameybacter sp.]|uniref:hypothetical protein n=1 Tax=Niameybacter sp. TaxID=2033640 RepID=UPI002FCA437A
MKTKIESLNVFKKVVMSVMLMFAFIFTSTSVFATEPSSNDYQTITFSNLESVGLNESIEMKITDKEGNPATIGIASGKCWLKGTTTGSDNDITVTYQM